MSDSRHRRAAELLAENHTLVATAEAVGVSERTVRRWRDSGKLSAAAAPPDTEADIARTNGHPPADPHTWSRKEAERRKQIALARKHELEVEERLGDLVARIRAQLDEQYGAMLDIVKQQTLAIEGRWSPLLACECRNPREVATLLRGLIRELLEHLSGPVADAFEAYGEAAAGPLPEDFPGRKPLEAAGIETLADLLAVEELPEVRGIGPVTEGKIREALAMLQQGPPGWAAEEGEGD